MAGSKICPNCGYTNPSTNRFCEDCGYDMDNGVESAPASAFKKEEQNKEGGKDKGKEKNKNHKKSIVRAIVLIVFFYFVADGLIILAGAVQYNLQLVKTGLDMSVLARYIIPDKYQIVSERAEMEQENSKGILIYYKDENGDILMRERRILSPGYHEIKPPEKCGEREYYLKSENRVTIDNNGHGTPNILHFYYKYSESSLNEQEK